jgi:hypothetical protein
VHTGPWTVSWTTIANTIAAFGVGSIITLLITIWQRHREWVKDNKKQEWRELISSLSQSFHYLKNYGFGIIGGEQQKGLLEADAEARRAIESRLFVAHQIKRENVLERWQLLAAERDWSRMVEYWNLLHGTLVAAAHKDLGIIPFWKRWFRG